MASDHALKLEKRLGNLQSLEALLRVYLLKVGQKSRSAKSIRHSYWNLRVGDVIDEEEFSNYDPLGMLIRKVNEDVRGRDASLLLDPAVVDIRDLLAHGRVAGEREDTSSLRIVKFGKPSNGTVIVVARTLMDDEWFARSIPLVAAQILTVGRALEQHAV